MSISPDFMPASPTPPRLLFVCMGNICRSPAAEGVMRHLVSQAGLESQVEIDSAGTIGLHAGKLPDARMRKAADRRGYKLTHLARQVRPSDLDTHDLILVMDTFNQADLRALTGDVPLRARIQLFCEYCTQHPHTEVPDPYYGGSEGFEEVLDLLEDGCANLIHHLRNGTLLTESEGP